MTSYRGSFELFDASAIRPQPIDRRSNKLTLSGLIDLEAVRRRDAGEAGPETGRVAAAVQQARSEGRPVILFTGAHPVKLGLGPLIVDLMARGLVTHVAGTGATAIHDFELALIGGTSENVPNALPEGTFGMADETGGLINRALAAGYERGLGFGEALGRLIIGEPMPEARRFAHPEVSILAAGVRLGVPVTIHVGIGTDIIDQHPDFDGAAKGGASGFDFGIYTASVAKLDRGGVVLNVGSAVTGPEVLLKAAAMTANVGRPPREILAADFDLRPVVPADADDEDRPTYYFRDHKSVVTRIPAAFGGRGVYVQGNFKQTLPALYRALTG